MRSPRRRWAAERRADLALPVDPDLGDAQPQAERAGRPAADLATLLAVFIGGSLGTLARYEAGLAWPDPADRFATTTFVVNTSGALLIGALIAVLTERLAPPHRLARPLLATGLLGGWTTMSTLAVGADRIASLGGAGRAVGYLAATLGAGLAGVLVGLVAGRRLAWRTTP